MKDVTVKNSRLFAWMLKVEQFIVLSYSIAHGAEYLCRSMEAVTGSGIYANGREGSIALY